MDLKCKSCGFPLVVKPGEVVAKCEACGLVNTLPSMDTDQKILRCNRANDYRQNCEFDQAAQLFQDILKEDAREPEAYWGLVLCKYGVQYVDDPKDGHRVPTCNRIQSIPIMADVDYKKALTYAEDSRLGVYQYQAKEIDEIQKKIIEISSHEKPYDVFICYKELDNLTGQRTQDSVLAQELYRELTDYHLRVFFSRITLREKLGVEYEPYIYAALTSAPVMIHVTTSYNNSNAPWVKNEWSRYLSLKNSGSDKSFTVAYKGLNPDIALPKEFSGKQASDLSRVGAMQEIAEWASQAVKRYKEKQGRGHEDEEALKITLTRAFQYLAAGNRNQAEEMFRACVASDKTCAEAYLGLVMTRRNYMNRRQLGTGMVSLTDDLNFNLAVQYADEDLRRELESAEAQIQNRIREKREADAREAEKKRLEQADRLEKERERQAQLKKQQAEQEAREETLRKIKQEAIRKKEQQKARIIGGCICGVFIIGFLFYNTLIKPELTKASQYREATALLENNEYEEAYWKFIKLAGMSYKDSSQMLDTVYQQCLSDAKTRIQNGDYQGALSALEGMEECASYHGADEFYKTKYQACLGLNEYDLARDCVSNYSDSTEAQSAMQELNNYSIQNAAVGSSFFMGQFEQDNNADNGTEPIEWTVLDLKDGKAFVISKKILTYKPFSETENVAWENSTIRQWLNGDFYNTAFSDEEKNRVIETKQESIQSSTVFWNRDDAVLTPHYSFDKVTLLSSDEVSQYFSSDDIDLHQEYTNYAVAQRQMTSNSIFIEWLLRSPFMAGYGNAARCSSADYQGGNTLTISTLGAWQSNDFAIRPAMWVDTTK